MAGLHDAPLGKDTQYPTEYNAGLLHPIPRAPGREAAHIINPLPFTGYDLWTAYEVSWLDLNGKPVVAIGYFSFTHASPNIIESKSFKLYLNSFNMSSFASKATVQALMQKDLSDACGALVDVQLRDLADTANHVSAWTIPSLDDYELTEDVPSEPDVSVLQVGDVALKAKWQSHLFRSLCPVTAQPDWASIRIEYQGQQIDPSSLLTYLVSYRTHQGFHEQCVEQIFRDLVIKANPSRLLVEARFMRRGGLDINPLRMKGMFEVSHQRLSRQ